MKHTPTPWMVFKRVYNIYAKGKTYPYTENLIATHQIHPQLKQNSLITTIGVSMDEDGEKQHRIVISENDANFIVEACNNYERLKSENKRLRKALESVRRECSLDLIGEQIVHKALEGDV